MAVTSKTPFIKSGVELDLAQAPERAELCQSLSFFFFSYEILTFSSSIVEKTTLSPSELSWDLGEHQLTVNIRVQNLYLDSQFCLNSTDLYAICPSFCRYKTVMIIEALWEVSE